MKIYFIEIFENVPQEDIFGYLILAIVVFCIFVALAGGILGWWRFRKETEKRTELLSEILTELRSNKKTLRILYLID
jgi:hypothetical protein